MDQNAQAGGQTGGDEGEQDGAPPAPKKARKPRKAAAPAAAAPAAPPAPKVKAKSHPEWWKHPPLPAFVRVKAEFVVLAPFQGEPVLAAVAGDILRSDDPILDTSGLEQEFASKHGLLRHDTRFRVEPAPDATAHTIKVPERLAKFYDLMQFDGYRSERDRLRAEKHRKDTGAQRPQARRTSGPVSTDDLAIPPRRPVARD